MSSIAASCYSFCEPCAMSQFLYPSDPPQFLDQMLRHKQRNKSSKVFTSCILILVVPQSPDLQRGSTLFNPGRVPPMFKASCAETITATALVYPCLPHWSSHPLVILFLQHRNVRRRDRRADIPFSSGRDCSTVVTPLNQSKRA